MINFSITKSAPLMGYLKHVICFTHPSLPCSVHYGIHIIKGDISLHYIHIQICSIIITVLSNSQPTDAASFVEFLCTAVCKPLHVRIGSGLDFVSPSSGYSLQWTDCTLNCTVHCSLL